MLFDGWTFVIEDIIYSHELYFFLFPLLSNFFSYKRMMYDCLRKVFCPITSFWEKWVLPINFKMQLAHFCCFLSHHWSSCVAWKWSFFLPQFRSHTFCSSIVYEVWNYYRKFAEYTFFLLQLIYLYICIPSLIQQANQDHLSTWDSPVLVSLVLW